MFHILNHVQFYLRKLVCVSCFCSAMLIGAEVHVNPGDDLSELVSRSSPGTRYVLAPGLYRALQVTPHDGDHFVASGTTVLSGAAVLSGFSSLGSQWVKTLDITPGQTAGVCLPSAPACQFSEDLFFDNVPLQRVTSVSDLTVGTWFLDYSNKTIWVHDNPANHTVEISLLRSAFKGLAKNVVIQGLRIEKYASPAQIGAIGDQTPGTGWQVINCDVRLNHGAGIRLSNSSQVLNSTINNNGQEGIRAYGNGIQIKNTEIAYNGYAGFDPDWEAGGAKFSETNNLVVSNNVVHDNRGPGLWTDYNNVSSQYDSNLVFDNLGEGIKHEISYSALVRNNVAYGNGKLRSTWLWGSQILIQNSQNVNIIGNNVTVSAAFGNGIGIIYQNRGSGSMGPFNSRNIVVSGNVLNYEGPSGQSGYVSDFGNANTKDLNIIFDKNSYMLTNLADYHWNFNCWFMWSQLQTAGIELNGTADLIKEN